MLIATGATPRVLPDAEPDGERILTWRQVYDLPELPERLVVVGSGVTGAEFASAYLAAGVDVTLVSSRDRVMPHEDPDAATVIEKVFRARGMTILSNARADRASAPVGDGVVVDTRRRPAGRGLARADGGRVGAQHRRPGLREYGVERGRRAATSPSTGCRAPTCPGIYAAGDCTGVLALASVAAMQGRIAMWHALGEAVAPLRLRTVSANVFTDPELATVGVSQADVDTRPGARPRSVMLPLAGNARAKMADVQDGFVKLFCRPASGLVDRRRRRRAEGERADPADRPGGGEPPDRGPAGPHDHASTRRCPARIAEAARQLMQHEFE